MKEIKKEQKTIENLKDKYNLWESIEDDKKQYEFYVAQDLSDRCMLNFLLNNNNLTGKKGEDIYLTDMMLIDGFFTSSIDDVLIGLKRYDINEFVYMGTSTSSSQNIMTFLKNGFVIEGVVEYKLVREYDFKKHESYYSVMEGIKFVRE